MGYLDLCPAEKVSAWYDNMSQSLCLHAEGITPFGADDVHFEPELSILSMPPPPPTFRLVCWVRGIGNGAPFDLTTPFHVPRPVDGKVIIKTKNNPDGIVVPVPDIEGLDEDKATPISVATLPPAPTPNKADVPPETLLPMIPVFVRLGEPFELSEKIPPGAENFGMVDVSFDAKALSMESASYRFNQINWKMKGISVGYTQFIIKTLSMAGIPITRRIVISVDKYWESAPKN